MTPLTDLTTYSDRTHLEEKVHLYYRRKGEDSEGRGNSWAPAKLFGWDDGCALIWCGLSGHSRTLSLDLWELSPTRRKSNLIEVGYAG